MSTAELRDQIHEYIDSADEGMLLIIEELFRMQENDAIPSWQKTILDERIAKHDENPKRAKYWEDVRLELRNMLTKQ